MKREVHLNQEAQLDLEEALQWYAPRGQTVKFIWELEEVFGLIEENFELFPIVRKNVRRALVKYFPYSVLYVEKADKLEVIAIFHQSRNPAIWEERL